MIETVVVHNLTHKQKQEIQAIWDVAFADIDKQEIGWGITSGYGYQFFQAHSWSSRTYKSGR